MRSLAKYLQVYMIVGLCVLSSGCLFLVVGAAGAVGGYAVSSDTFQGVSAKSQDELLAAAHKVLSIMGSISDERPKDGELVGTVYGAHITVDVIQVNMTTSKLRVKARQYMMPRIAVAQEVYTKIMNQLEQ